MIRKPLYISLLISLCVALIGASCRLFAPGITDKALPTPATGEISPTPVEGSVIPTPTQASVITPQTSPPAPSTPALTPAPEGLPTCDEEVCVLSISFPLERPIAPPGRQIIDVSYRFGSSDHGKRDPHHGVEFLNSAGTPVLAAAEGVVVLAGDDAKTVYGLYRNFYGNLVVLEHNFSGFSQPVYTLYAHLSQIDVEKGEEVSAGQKIGEVGSSGAAIGSHLHFEVRLGENSYNAVRNPELWLRPLADENGQPFGVIAGRILDAQGKPVKISNIVVERLTSAGAAQDTYYISTYSETKLIGLEPWEESFAIGDLPAGDYQISFWQGGMQQKVVTVQPGALTLVTFLIGP